MAMNQPFKFDTVDQVLVDYNLQANEATLEDVLDSEMQLKDLFTQHILNVADTSQKLEFETTNPDQFKTETFPPDAVASFILPEDRIYLVLLNTIYQACLVSDLEPWSIVCDLNVNPHIAVWENSQTSEYFVGMRGTSPFNRGGWEDIMDDTLVTFGMTPILNSIFQGTGTDTSRFAEQMADLIGESTDVCNTMRITMHGRQVIQSLLGRTSASQITIAGHSLGGRAAACLAVEFGLKRAVLFNAAGPPTNPLRTGLGPGRQIHYHIAGDLISSHSDPAAMTVVLIDNHSYPIPPTQTVPPMLMLPGQMRSTWPTVDISKALNFDLVAHHTLNNFLSDNGKTFRGLLTADEYDAMWIYFSTHFGPEWGWDLLKGIATLGILQMMFYFIAWNSPIPGCRRETWLKRLGNFCSSYRWSQFSDHVNCMGRLTWNSALLMVLGPVIVPFFKIFYTLALMATGVFWVGDTAATLDARFKQRPIQW